MNLSTGQKKSASHIPVLRVLGQTQQKQNNGLRYKASHYTIRFC